VRAVVGGLGVLAIVGALVGWMFGAPSPAIILPIVAGIILILGTLFERIYYKRVERHAPSGFIATDERFIDPATGRLVEVHYRPDTGQRVYVDAGAAPPK
jgi:hypothetical protein